MQTGHTHFTNRAAPGFVGAVAGAVFGLLVFAGYCARASSEPEPAPHSAEALPTNPSSAQLTDCRVFAGKLVPMPGHPPLPGENSALSAALKKYAARTEPDDLSSITDFLTQYPTSTWKAALLTNIATIYYSTGHFDSALDAWETAWNLSKSSTDPGMRAIADWAVSQFATMNARIGRQDRIEALLKELRGRRLSGPSAQYLLGAKEGYLLMVKHPGLSFRCGPLAVGTVLAYQHSPAAESPLIGQCRSTKQGITLATLKNLTDRLGVHFQVAKRSAGAQIILPAVVHWKVNHYGALLARVGNRIILKDRTFGADLSVTPSALDTDSDGYFLIPPGKLPPGWQPVGSAEAATVWGRGVSANADPNHTTNCDGQSGGDGGGGCDMPSYAIHTMLVSLHIFDTPLPYKPPYGQPLNFSVSYCQRGILPPYNPDSTTYANLGGQWTFNWVSYISDDPTTSGTQAEVYLYVRGGGVRPYFFLSGTTYGPQESDQSTLIATTTNSYELDYTDGSKDFFTKATPVVGPGRIIFMTESEDPAGNIVYINYNSDYEVTSVQGAAGASLQLTYDSNKSVVTVSDSNGLVSDPNVVLTGSSRQVSFTYNSSGELSGITDAAGMSSSFTYGYGGAVVTAMTTPYGTTTFTCGDALDDETNDYTLDTNIRWLQATDPLGASERLEYWAQNNAIPGLTYSTDIDGEPTASDPVAPPSWPDNEYLNDQNSFYWSKKAFMDDPADYSKAVMTHWLHDSQVFQNATGVVESLKKPFENRVWAVYPGQTNPIAVGTIDSPSAVARVVVDSDTATQMYQYQYNAAGNVTEVTDPIGRITSYGYNNSNNIDVQAIYQANPSASGTDPFGNHADQIAAFGYDSNHNIISATNAAGQVTTGSYNSNGQILSQSVVQSGTTEKTTWTYDSNGFLTEITGPISSATNAFTYDNYDRILTAMDSQGFKLTYGYDNLNRLTFITYPDGSTEQTIYNRRDVEWKKDRQNRWTHYLHDELGRLDYVVDPAGHTTQYQYCPCGALTGIVDGNGNTTSFIYDAQSRLTRKVFADGSAINYTYEPTSSLLLSSTDALGQSKTYGYNLDNSLASVSFSGTSTPNVSYSYDPYYPRLTSMSESVTGTTTFSYNPASIIGTYGGGMLASASNSGPYPYTLTYGYDSLGHVVSRAIDGSTNTETTAFDALGRVTQVSDALGTFGYIPYNATNLLDHVVYQNPSAQTVLTSTFSYFTSGVSNERLETITNLAPATGGTISQFIYTYSPAADIASWSQASGTNAAVANQYGYDGADELLSATQTSGTQTLGVDAYRYDGAGNRLGQQIGNTLTNSAYNNLNQVTSVSGSGEMMISGSLNEPGTVLAAGSVVTTDSNNDFTLIAPVVAGSNSIPIAAISTGTNAAQTNKTLPINVTSGTPIPELTYDSNGDLTNDGISVYTWDAANRLIGVTARDGSGNHFQFSYDGFGRCVRIVEGPYTSSTTNLIWDGLTIREARNSSNAITKLYFANGVQITGTNYYYTRDHLGSIREMVTGTNASVQARYAYDPYGQQTQLTGTMVSDFGYTGQYYHQRSGLNLAPYREYSASLGRWISRDPLDNAEMRQGANLYDYVRNDPVNLVDLYGLLSDAAQQYVDSALDQSHGDIAAAYANVLNQRRSNNKCEPLRDAEHYLAAAEITQDQGLWGAAIMVAGTTLYSGAKALGLAGSPDATPGSLGEMAAGYEGIGYGLTHASLTPSGCNGLYNQNGAELPGYMGP